MRRTVGVAVSLLVLISVLGACASSATADDHASFEPSATEAPYPTESAYGVSVDGLGTQFTDFEGVEDPNGENWGWTNGTLIKGAAPYTLELWAGTARGVHEKGATVGIVYVDVDDGGRWTLAYETFPGYLLLEVHGYVGQSQLPLVRNGKKVLRTAAPGRYPAKEAFAFEEQVTDTVLLTNCLDDEVHAIAHAVVVALPTMGIDAVP